MSANPALLLVHNMEHALDRLSRAWARDGVFTISVSRPFRQGDQEVSQGDQE